MTMPASRIHHFTLVPIVRPSGDAGVLMTTTAGIVVAIPAPGERQHPVHIGGWQSVPWTHAHMHLLYGFVGQNLRNVGVARPSEDGMVLVVVEDDVAQDRKEAT